MEYIWNYLPEAKQEDVDHLVDVLKISPTLCKLLVQRGVKTFDDAKTFFRPQLTDLHNPFLMKDMDKAVNRLEKAMVASEKILVYGDYDVDGTTSVALVYSFLYEFYTNIEYYIPNRYNEGYGVSFAGINHAAEIGVSLIIALDCGIKAVDKVEYAKKQGIDFIICDHHTPGSKLPEAVAVLDPKREDCEYPFNELSGCGVGFKFLQAFSERNNIPFEKLTKHLDLVAVSIASDIVPIIGENRILAYFGLKQLNSQPRMGLQSLIKVAGIEGKELDITDVVFKIGPRINAAGRIESGSNAVQLLISTEEQEAKRFGDVINEFNTTRKNYDHNITHEALEIIQNDKEQLKKRTTVLFQPHWHKGVIGIVASRLIETYYRPTIILTESHGKATGSARSVNGFNLYNAIDACSDLLDSFGGHKYAAGLTLKIENIPEFKRRFEQIVAETIHDDMLLPQIDVDTKLDFEEINTRFYRILKQFAPFGPENMSPVFVSEGVVDCGSRLVGSTGEHLRVECKQKNMQFTGIAFSMANKLELLRNNPKIDICYAITENEFKGKTSLQLMVKDIKTKH